MAIKKQLQGLAIAIIFLLLYYGFFLNFTLTIKDNIVSVMEAHNLTQITIPVKVYNATTHTWVTHAQVFDLAGFVDLALTLAIVFAPLLFIFKYIFKK